MPDSDEILPAAKQKDHMIRVCLLGSEGSGKTCFLAGLAILGEPNRVSPMTVTPIDQVTASYLDELANTLRRQEWPPPTNMTNVLTIRVGIDSSIIEIVVVDYPGEDFRAALRTLQYEQIQTLYEHYAQSEAILLLFDLQSDIPESGTVSEKQIERQMAHLQAIADIWAERSTKKAGETYSQVDVGIVLTKSDTVPSLLTPSQAKSYFRKYAEGLDHKIRQNANEVKYFALSTIGWDRDSVNQNNEHDIPGQKIQPFGYDQLFQWVRRRHSHRKYRRLRLTLTAFTVMLAALCAGYIGFYMYAGKQIDAILDSPNLSTFDKLQRTALTSNEDVLQRRAEMLREELAKLSGDLKAADSESSISLIVSALRQYREAHPGALSSEIDDLLQEADDRKQDILYQLVMDSYNKKNNDFKEHAEEFLGEYPTSSRCDKVRELLGGYRTQQQQAARKRIKAIAVHDQSSLSSKSKRITEFLTKYGKDLTEEESPLMKRAAELGRQFSERHTYSLTLKRSGGFLKPRAQGVWLVVDGKIIDQRDSSGASKSVTWPQDVLKIQWQSGEPIKIILRDRELMDEDVAWMEDRGMVALRLLGSRQVLTQFAPGWKEECDEAFVEYQVTGINEDDWKAVEAYLTPGGAW